MHWYFLGKSQSNYDKACNDYKLFNNENDPFIEELNNSSEPLTKDYILRNIWEYSSEADTHTIETHIYRLRQKIKNKFDDKNFIKHTKKGYSF